MNETFDSAEQPSPWDQPGHGHQNEIANPKSCWRETFSFMLGYFIAQQQERNENNGRRFFPTSQELTD
jgi:hypothetical protein